MSTYNFPDMKARQEAQRKMKIAKRERIAELDKSQFEDTLKSLPKLSINNRYFSCVII